MMNILFVDSQYPMFDRASADVRMTAIVRLLREQGHVCDYFATDVGQAESRIGAAEVARYREALTATGVGTFERRGFESVLAEHRYDMVFFKYFYPAEHRMALTRIWQPWARVVVDSVDLVYARLTAKAEVSGLVADRAEAAQMKGRELAVYAAADMVVAVTKDESEILGQELPNLPIHVIPNIHEIPAGPCRETDFPSLLFVGTFTHEPNVDGLLWFAREVWPVIRVAHPDARLRVIGGNPPTEIQALEGNGVEVLGYVPNTLPYLMESWVSVAPLRFGAGMKGKVGEAMSCGLAVVTTGFGAEGFGLTPGEHLLVADDAPAFADAVISLLGDPALRRRIGQAGRAFIEERYSPPAVGRQLETLTHQLHRIAPRRLPFAGGRRLGRVLAHWLARRMLWRLRATLPHP